MVLAREPFVQAACAENVVAAIGGGEANSVVQVVVAEGFQANGAGIGLDAALEKLFLRGEVFGRHGGRVWCALCVQTRVYGEVKVDDRENRFDKGSIW